jgi:hypothetical protein
MALETVVTIGDLVPANPGSGDPKSAGDDHLRMIKTALRNSFAGMGVVMASGADGGAANAYTLTPANPLPDYGSRMLAIFSPTANSTGACTLAISGLAAAPLKTVFGSALSLGDLIVGQVYIAIYTGSEFRLITLTKNYIDQLTFASSGLPAVTGNAGKVLGTDGSSAGWVSPDLRGSPIFAKGNSGTTAQVINFTDGEGQTLTSTGAFVLSASGFIASRLCAVMLRLVNGGANGFSSTGINWIKSDGSLTTTFSSSGITLQVAGTDVILLFSYGDGTVYGKVAR